MAWREIKSLPKVLLMTSAIDWHAFILLMIWAFPWEVSVPSLRSKMLGC